MIKRHEVQVLLSARHSHRKVAKLADVSKRTVTRIAQEPRMKGLDEMGVARDRRLGCPSRTGEFQEVVEALLKEDPDLPTVEILHQPKLRGCKGGKSVVYELVKALRGSAPSRATDQIPAVRLMEEQKRLRLLVVPRGEYAIQLDVLVGPTGMVAYKGVRYAMPPPNHQLQWQALSLP